MTKATFFKDKDGLYTGFEISGHSGYAESGSDIVCAAVSAVSIAIINSLNALLHHSAKQKVNEASGYLYYKITDNHKDEKTQLLFETLYLALKATEESYPRNITILQGNGGNPHA